MFLANDGKWYIDPEQFEGVVIKLEMTRLANGLLLAIIAALITQPKRALPQLLDSMDTRMIELVRRQGLAHMTEQLVGPKTLQ